MNGRVHGRISLDGEIQCHINDAPEWVHIYDLSSGGAMIEVPSRKVAPGDAIRLNLFDFANATGQVAWVNGKNAGLRFDQPLAESIIRHLGFWSTSLSFDEWQPRDRFGQVIELRLQDSGDPDGSGKTGANEEERYWWQVASPQPDRRAHDRGDTPRRREERQDIAAAATLAAAMHDGVAGQLADFSANGCSFVQSDLAYGVGQAVWIRIGELEPLRGTIRWATEDRAGIEFDRALHPAVFEHLAKANPSAVCAKAA